MRSAIGIFLALTVMVGACAKKGESSNSTPATIKKIEGYWQVTSVTKGEAKVNETVNYTRLLHFHTGRVWHFNESHKNTAWTDEQDYSVASQDLTPEKYKEFHIHVTFDGDKGTFVPMGKTGEIEPNEKIVAKRISKEEAERLIAEVNKKSAPAPTPSSSHEEPEVEFDDTKGPY